MGTVAKLVEPPEGPAQAVRVSIGTRLRHSRLAQGIRLKDVAAAAGCSESLISKLENDRFEPSLNLLHRVCDALGLTLGWLFADAAGSSEVVFRSGSRIIAEIDPIRRGEGIRMERLVPYAPGNLLQGNIHVVAVGGSTDGLISHQGEEVGYVIEGSIELRLGERAFALHPGDSFYFRSDTPHGYRNIGTVEARIIFVNTPASF
jgi:transcriptional regulator with XRE-family HTH domain